MKVAIINVSLKVSKRIDARFCAAEITHAAWILLDFIAQIRTDSHSAPDYNGIDNNQP